MMQGLILRDSWSRGWGKGRRGQKEVVVYIVELKNSKTYKANDMPYQYSIANKLLLNETARSGNSILQVE